MSLKALLGTPDLKVGHFIVEFATPGIGHIVKNAGCDFAMFDLEHSGFSFETTKAAVRYFEAAQIPTIIRVPSKSVHHIARGLDVGIEALMLPMVNDAQEAQSLIEAIRYAPLGQRGVALGIAHDNYRSGDVMATLEAANQRTAFVALIETADGCENAEEIAALDGVDCLWVGHFDLSCSLGIPGDFENEKFVKAVDKVLKAAANTGKSVGRLGGTVDSCAALYGQGYDLVCYSGDVWLLGAALKAGVEDLRAKAKPAAPPQKPRRTRRTRTTQRESRTRRR